MANNYYQATMTPDSIHLSEMHQVFLGMTGANCEKESDGRFYVTWGECLNEDIDDFEIIDALNEGTITEEQADFIGKTDFNSMLRHILYRNPKVTHILVEGAWTCDRMKPGQFGGSAIMVTRTEYADISTGSVDYDKETGKIKLHGRIRQFDESDHAYNCPQNPTSGEETGKCNCPF